LVSNALSFAHHLLAIDINAVAVDGRARPAKGR
jgi:hypothetical protein